MASKVTRGFNWKLTYCSFGADRWIAADGQPIWDKWVAKMKAQGFPNTVKILDEAKMLLKQYGKQQYMHLTTVRKFTILETKGGKVCTDGVRD